MINLKFLLGFIPKTETIEQKEAALIKEYNELEEFKASKELKHFFDLKAFVEAPDFKKKEEEIRALDFKRTQEFLDEKEYYVLKKSARIKNYYKVLGSVLYKNYSDVKDTEELKRYFELKSIIESAVFKEKEQTIKALKYTSTEEYRKEQEFNALQKSAEIKNYYKHEKSEPLNLYNSLHGSKELDNYNELKKFCESEETKNLEKRIKSAKFSETSEFEQLKQCENIKKSPGIKNYFRVLISEVYKIWLELHESEILDKYKELHDYIDSEEFKTQKKNSKEFKGSEAQLKEQEFLKLKSDKRLRKYFEFIQSKPFNDFKAIEKSGEVEKLEKLETFIKSDTFIKVNEYYKLSPDKRWQQQEEYKKVSEYNSLKSDKRFPAYFKFESSKELKMYIKTVDEGLVTKFEKLKEFLNRDEFKKLKEYMLLPADKKWEQTEEYGQREEFKKLSKEKRIIDYIKFIATNEFKLFNEVIESGEVKHYEELEKQVNSEKFKEYKTYMLLSFKDKWIKTEEYSKNEEYISLVKSSKIIWYFKVVDSNKFDEVKAWTQTFSEDFDSAKLDKSVWLTRFYWGNAILNDSYSLSDDKHFNTDGTNLSVENSILKIETRKEKVTGKAWNPLFGFQPKEFEYTSGLLNTGQSFRQKHGRFKAKIKVSNNKSTTHAFWLVGNHIIPQVDILKYKHKRFSLNIFWGDITGNSQISRISEKFLGSKLSSGFYIYELEWTPEELTWKINGLVLKKEKSEMLSEPMYMQLSSGIFEKANGQGFPVTMEIDWVRCFQKA
jgi:beta-glucanase (GH16 family)